MTDGLLLAEIQRDRLLRRYDTIIVDEAHERSLNIDFLLGYLKRILPRRPDLKLIITSATIDPERFAAHFGDAPIIEVSRPHLPGRGPLPRRPTRTTDQADAIGDAVDELLRETPGDVLVFLSGEREIRDTADALQRPAARRRRDPAAVRAPVRRRAAARLPAAHAPARRARHQRRRDVADRARHPLRRRPRDGADLPLQRAAEGAAAADRADLAGLRRPAQGPLRAHGRRHLHPALRRGGLRRAPALHRPGDPAHEPRRGDPADGGDRPRRRRGLPVPGPARPPPGARRRSRCCRSSARSTSAGAGSRRSAASSRSCRSTRGWAGWCSRPTRCDCADEVIVIAAALSIQDPRERPADQQAQADQAARPLRRRALGLPRLPEPVALPARAAARAVGQPVPQARQGRVPALPAHARVAGPRRPAAPGGQAASGITINHDAGRARGDPPGAAVRAAVPRRPARRGRGASTPGARGARFALLPGSALAREASRPG